MDFIFEFFILKIVSFSNCEKCKFQRLKSIDFKIEEMHQIRDLMHFRNLKIFYKIENF